MDTLLHDLRYALRSLARYPGFTAAVVLTLALGIGANTAIFSVVDGVLFRPAPFADLGRVMMVWETDRASGTTREPAAIPDFRDFQQRARGFETIAALVPTEANLTREGADPRRLPALGVSREFFSVTGLRPIEGRTFTAEEDRAGGPRAALISEALWAELFTRDKGAIGKTIRLNDVEWSVAGVLPRDADFGALQILGAAAYGRGFAERGGRVRVDVWLPLRASPSASRDNHPIFLLGRLATGATPATAQQEMAAIAADLERTYPSNAARGAFVEPLEQVVFGPVRQPLYVLLGAVALVLLVACANVAHLVLVRSAGRVREVSVRTALGAGARRLARQFLVEGAVLTLAGAALGVVLALSGLETLRALAPATIPRVESVGLDVRVLGVTLAVSAAVALALGLLPTLQARRPDLQRALQGETGRGASPGHEQRRLRSLLVVSELAMAAMLMVGAGLLIKSLWRLSAVDPGFAAAGVLKAEFQLPTSRYPQDFSKWPNWPERRRFNDELQVRLAATPGVQAVTLAAANPLDAGFTSSIRVVGREAEARGWPEPSVRNVSASYFSTMRVPVREGRAFEPSDAVSSAPIVVINEAAYQRYFAARNAIGQRINLWGANRTIVGIVGNERFKGLTESAPPAVYLPLSQAPVANAVLVRTSGDPAAAAGALRRVVRELDPLLPLFGVEPLTETIGHSIAQRRFTMLVLGVFAAVALLLAAVGVHGVLSHAVARRTREIGIRMALGADPRGVRALVVSEGAALAGVGIAVGLAAALALSRLLTTLLFGVSDRDPAIYAGSALALGAVALVATVLPARRAARVDPMEALRSE